MVECPLSLYWKFMILLGEFISTKSKPFPHDIEEE
jgi:hypothetical protein